MPQPACGRCRAPGTPIALADATSTRFSADAGIFLPSRPVSGITYRTVPRLGVRRRHASGGAGRAGSGPVRLSRLSAVGVRGVGAGAGGDDDPSSASTPSGHGSSSPCVYVPEGPGGQTIGSVEALSARTTHAATSRCS